MKKKEWSCKKDDDAHMFANKCYKFALEKSNNNAFDKKHPKKLKQNFDMNGSEDKAKKIAEAKELEDMIFGEEIMYTSNLARQLLMNKNFYSANIWEEQRIKEILVYYNDIVLSRLNILKMLKP